MNIYGDHKKMLQGSALALIMILAGCSPLGWMGGKKEGAELTESAKPGPASKDDIVLVTVDGKAEIYKSMLDKQVDDLKKNNPQLEQLLQYMPNIVDQILESMANQIAIGKYVEEKKLDQTDKYKENLRKAYDQARKIVNISAFREDCVKELKDDELKKFYDEHKDSIPGVKVSPGGVPTFAVTFDKEADAKAFLNKAAGKSAEDFKKLATSEKLDAKFRDYRFVNAQSYGIDAGLRDKVLTLKPGVELVKVDKAVYVVHTGAKEEPKYKPLEETKDAVKKFAQQQNEEEVMTKTLKGLNEKYKIVVKKTVQPEPAEKTAEKVAGENAKNESAAEEDAEA